MGDMGACIESLEGGCVEYSKCCKWSDNGQAGVLGMPWSGSNYAWNMKGGGEME